MWCWEAARLELGPALRRFAISLKAMRFISLARQYWEKSLSRANSPLHRLRCEAEGTHG